MAAALIAGAERRSRRTGGGAARLLVAGQPVLAGVTTFAAFEECVDDALAQWALSLDCMVVSRGLDAAALAMVARYARERRRRVYFVATRVDDFGRGASAALCNAAMIAQTTHSLLFAPDADLETRDVYRRSRRELRQCVCYDALSSSSASEAAARTSAALTVRARS